MKQGMNLWITTVLCSITFIYDACNNYNGFNLNVHKKYDIRLASLPFHKFQTKIHSVIVNDSKPRDQMCSDR